MSLTQRVIAMVGLSSSARTRVASSKYFQCVSDPAYPDSARQFWTRVGNAAQEEIDSIEEDERARRQNGPEH